MTEFLFLMFGVFVLAGLFVWLSGQAEAGKERKNQLLGLAQKAQREIDKIPLLKTLKGQANTCRRARHYLEQAAEIPQARLWIHNLDELSSRLEMLEKVLPVVEHIERANRHRFKGSRGAEKNALLDALYAIRVSGVSEADFSEAEIIPDGDNEPVTPSAVQKRLKDLGWQET